MKVTFKLSGEDEQRFIAMLEKSGLNQSQFVRQCIFESKVISIRDKCRDRQLYQDLHLLNNAIADLKSKHKNWNYENIEMGINKLCHTLLSL